ncbi:hypothetical protein PR048_024182 [Dryococelus australis]|uniref:DDE-1 domain-containing protein n=1 Tax=Dryococelus australis TaxID=614101 RepID=A0ABQ9GW64_9NEOP|nr:hypothetical protein PR048_024182 [Dryococelus australis]
MDWLRHFQDHVKSTPEQSVLLILDNHYSHVMLEANEFSKLHGIVMVSTPPHSPHHFQPLDVTFLGPLKKAYHNECDISMKVNVQRIIRPEDFAALISVSGFKATGIMPLDANIFTNEDFAFEIETGNLTTVPQASFSKQVETNIEKATVSTPPTNDTADFMANTCTSIQNKISGKKENKCGHHVKNNTSKKIPKELENKCGHHVKNSTSKKIPKELENKCGHHVKNSTSKKIPKELENKCGHHVKNNTSKKIPKELENKCGHHVKNNTSKKIPKELENKCGHHVKNSTSKKIPKELENKCGHQVKNNTSKKIPKELENKCGHTSRTAQARRSRRNLKTNVDTTSRTAQARRSRRNLKTNVDTTSRTTQARRSRRNLKTNVDTRQEQHKQEDPEGT